MIKYLQLLNFQTLKRHNSLYRETWAFDTQVGGKRFLDCSVGKMETKQRHQNLDFEKNNHFYKYEKLMTTERNFSATEAFETGLCDTKLNQFFALIFRTCLEFRKKELINCHKKIAISHNFSYPNQRKPKKLGECFVSIGNIVVSFFKKRLFSEVVSVRVSSENCS